MKDNKENKRMRELVEMFQQKDEIFIKKTSDKTNQDKISKEFERLKKLADGSLNSEIKENFYMGPGKVSMGVGKTVNSIVDDMYTNPSVVYQPIKQPLQAEEAFMLAIKRTLKSGAPVNDISFYDEVNWNLMGLGFPAKQPLDIKNALLRLVGDDIE